MYASFMKGISYIHNVDYDFQPIQQLAKYHLMIKDALRKMELSGKDVSIIRRAEIDFKRIMERIYDIRYESKIRSERTHYTITI